MIAGGPDVAPVELHGQAQGERADPPAKAVEDRPTAPALGERADRRLRVRNDESPSPPCSAAAGKRLRAEDRRAQLQDVVVLGRLPAPPE
eukprot:1815058-Alexandrium_andersonii.AAC.1